jgi:hypothetical protein
VSHPPLVIDADSIRDRPFLRWLSCHYGHKVLPVVAYVESALYFARKGGTPQDETVVQERLMQFDDLLRRAGVLVFPLNRAEVRNAVVSAVFVDELPWTEHKMDHLIAGYASIPPRVVVTRNKRHFEQLLSPDRVLDPYEVIAAWP